MFFPTIPHLAPTKTSIRLISLTLDLRIFLVLCEHSLISKTSEWERRMLLEFSFSTGQNIKSRLFRLNLDGLYSEIFSLLIFLMNTSTDSDISYDSRTIILSSCVHFSITMTLFRKILY